MADTGRNGDKASRDVSRRAFLSETAAAGLGFVLLPQATGCAARGVISSSAGRNNWRSPTDPTRPRPTDLYLARVPRDHIQDRNAWQFYTAERGTAPAWSHDIAQRRAVLHDERTVYPELQCGGRPGEDVARDVGVISQGSAVYNAPLNRYIYTSWTWYTWEFYEAPQPWGPWRLFLHKDFGGGRWHGSGAECGDRNEGGYSVTIPSKYISADGRTMWVQSNTNNRWNYTCGRDNYGFSLRRLVVSPFTATEPANRRDRGSNLARAAATTPIEKCASLGRVACYNDGDRITSESSLDCDARKTHDFWGYTWPRSYNRNRVVHTTGETAEDGGWFDRAGGGLRVQVRQRFTWIDVDALRITPDYPYDRSAGPNRSFVLAFRDTWGDGTRIIGPPGGGARFTSIAEMEVYFAD